MTTAKEIIDSASTKAFDPCAPCVLTYQFTFRPMPIDIVHNEREMLQLLNRVVEELELGPRTGCAACGGSGCDRCIPDEFDNDMTGEK